jgi:hypothetical protein
MPVMTPQSTSKSTKLAHVGSPLSPSSVFLSSDSLLAQPTTSAAPTEMVQIVTATQ